MQIILASSPYLIDYILRKRMLKELYNLLIIYHVKWISFIKILLKQIEPHFLFILNLIHEFLGNLYQPHPYFLYPSLHETKLAFHFLNELNELAASFYNVKGNNK